MMWRDGGEECEEECEESGGREKWPCGSQLWGLSPHFAVTPEQEQRKAIIVSKVTLPRKENTKLHQWHKSCVQLTL